MKILLIIAAAAFTGVGGWYGWGTIKAKKAKKTVEIAAQELEKHKTKVQSAYERIMEELTVEKITIQVKDLSLIDIAHIMCVASGITVFILLVGFLIAKIFK